MKLVVRSLVISLLLLPGIIYSQPKKNSTSWKGSISKLWSDSKNWTNGVPGTNTDVTIPWLSATAYQPEINVDATFNSLTMSSNPNTLTIKDNITVTITDKISIGNSATFNVNNGILNVSSDLTTGGNITLNNGTINFKGGFDYKSGGSLSVETGTINVGSASAPADFTVEGNNVFALNNGTLNIYGTATFYGSSELSFDGGNVNLYGTTNIYGSTVLNFGNSNVFIAGNIIVTGSGNINADSSNINMEGEIWQIANGASFDPGTSTITFDNNETVVVGGGGVSLIEFYNVVIKDGAEVTSQVNMLIYKNLTVIAPATFSFSANKTLDVIESVDGSENVSSNNPYIINIIQNDENNFTLYFNMSVDSASSQNSSNYKVVNANGETVAKIKTAKRHTGSNTNVVTITIDFNSKSDNTGDLYLVANNIKSTTNTSISTDHTKLLKSGSESSPLPVTLLSFSGKQDNNEILLQWATATETNNDYFTIEKAVSNLNDWSVIGYIKGTGNSNEILNYNFTDDNPVEGIQYYRLKQTDYDGKFEYFAPVAIEYKQTENIKLQLYPNPAQSFITLSREANSQANMNISILDCNGKIMIQESNYEGNSYNADISNLQNGLYVVNVNIGSDFQQMRFVKTN